MPKKVFKISDFSKGLVGNASPRDIPDDAMSYGENVDSRVRGKIEGIRGNDDVTVTISEPPRVMNSVLGEDNLLLGQDDSRNIVKYDIDADSWATIDTISNYARTVTPIDDGAILSMTSAFRSGNPASPQIVSKIENPPFSGSSLGYEVEDAECKSFASSPVFKLAIEDDFGIQPAWFSGQGDGEVFEASTKYFWAISIVYDGYMESPLIFGDTPSSDLWGITSAFDYTRATLQIVMDGTVPERATGINIYRAESPDGGDEPLGEYRLIKHIDTLQQDETPESYKKITEIDGDVSSGATTIPVTFSKPFIEGHKVEIGSDEREVVGTTSSSITIDSGLSSNQSDGTDVNLGHDHWGTIDGGISGSYYYVFRDNGSQGATYEDNTGVPETLETTSVDYKIATEYGSYLFVGGCAKDEIDDAAKYVFRSKPKTYSIIDWSQDFVILPEEPNALMGFGGRLYAFGSANMYRINPLTMEIEDTYAGVGALNENMVVATNYGMFHADDNNIYHNTGTVSQPIGDPILTLQESTEYGWQELKKTNASNEHYASMAFDPKNKRLLLFAEITGTPDTICWAYDVERKRWDLYPDFDIPSTTAVGPSGTLYATVGDSVSGFDLKKLFTSSSRKNWKVKTRDFDLGSDSGDFWAYDLQGYGDGNFNIKYAKDGGSLTDNGTSTVEGLRKTTVASADKKMKSIAVQVESASGSDSLDNLTIQFRPQVIQE